MGDVPTAVSLPLADFLGLDWSSEIGPGVAILTFVILASTLAATAWRNRREETAATASTRALAAIEKEMEAWKSAADRIGREKDAVAAELEQAKLHVAGLEARTDLTSLTKLVTDSSKEVAAMFERVATRLDEQDVRAADRESRMIVRHEEALELFQKIVQGDHPENGV